MLRLIVVVVVLLQYPLLAQQLQPDDGGMQSRIKPSSDAELLEITASATPEDKTDLGQPTRFGRLLVALLRQERFERLDLLTDQARASKSRFAGGGWKLYGIYGDLSQVDCGPKDDEWEPCISRINRWIALRPQSVAARIVLAMVYRRYAPAGSMQGAGPEVSAALWRRFHERLDRASEALDQAAALNPRDPQILVVRIQLASDRKWERPKLEALLDEAVSQDTGYYYAFQEYARTMAHGGAGATAHFAASTADRIGGTVGDIVYFHVAHTLGDFDFEILNAMSWWRIERGYEATESEYGFLPLKLNWLCRIATLKDEQLAAAKLFDRIGNDWDPGTWGSQAEFETNRSLAYSVRRLGDHGVSDIAQSAYREYNERTAEFVQKEYGRKIAGCFASKHREVPNDFNVYLRVTAIGRVIGTNLFSDEAMEACLDEALQKASLPRPLKGSVARNGGLWLRIAFHDFSLGE